MFAKQKPFENNFGFVLFSVFQSKNTPTVVHQTLLLFCEKIFKNTKSMILSIVNRGNSGVLNKNTNCGKREIVLSRAHQNLLFPGFVPTLV